MSDEIDATQAVAIAATLVSASRRPRASTPEPIINLADDSNAGGHNSNDNRKRPFETLQCKLKSHLTIITRPAFSSNSNASSNHFASIGAKHKTPTNK